MISKFEMSLRVVEARLLRSKAVEQQHRAQIINLTAKDIFSLHGSDVYTSLLNDKGDISALYQYDWYE